MDIQTFTIETALETALSLKKILASRTHRKKILGQEVIVPGQLGEALQLPRIIARLQSRHQRQRDQGLEDFTALWQTLSSTTRANVFRALGWYDPQDLDWEDKRSNRRPRPGLED
ncbi:hypothetical protein [Marinobacter changyiensis]|uniref:hypothetical protein n=1 Tax=Marinobacter changyiensis TaxID=2604091 RepID=UPI0012646D39|nr:hypothetical protein [Marinobacter changyiensis]